MSFQFNSDKETIKAVNPSIVAGNRFVVRGTTGLTEREIFRSQLDQFSGLPRVGINRTGTKVETIRINTGQQGVNYTSIPTVTLGAPDLEGGIQALASAVISEGRVVAIAVINPGEGYLTAPQVTISGGGGSGAAATAFLDTIDFELDVKGAIRTSSSIISDTARIINLDIENFVTPDLKLSAPNLKTWANGTGIQFTPNVVVQKNSYLYAGGNIYQVMTAGVTGPFSPTHTDGIQANGTAELKHIGFRINDASSPFYLQTGDAGIFPRSITPLLGDKSDKIATTEYVLNLAQNDVGGRVYVSQQIGDDSNDGRSAVAPVRTIKRACQLASETIGVKETVIVSGGDYVEDNPISIPPDCSIVGDNLRLVIVRPGNPGKHMFKFGDKNYLTGLVFRDAVDSAGSPVATWDFAMVFDDKQRIYYDPTTGGDFKRNFPIGHQIFGPNKIRVTFQNHTGTTNLVSGNTVTGSNTGAIGTVSNVSFNTTTGPSAYISGTVDVDITSGTFNPGETFEYTVSGQTYSFISTNIVSIRAEGEVVSHETEYSDPLPITRIDFSKQGTPETSEGGYLYDESENNSGGVIFYTNPLVGSQNIHDFKEGQEILISGLSVLNPDLSFLNGKQRIYKVLRDADGRSRRFVIQKISPDFTDSNYEPLNANVRSQENHVTLSLLNSPNPFSVTPPISRRFQDACILIKNNIPFIVDEAYLQTIEEFPALNVPSENKCRRDIGHFISAILRDVEFGGNYHTIEAAQTYITGDRIGFVGNEITETLRAFDIARRLAILAMRKWRTGDGTPADPVYVPQYSLVERYFDNTVIDDLESPACANVASAIDTLGYLFKDILTNNTDDRFLDASYLIGRNEEFIASEALGYAEAQYPSLGLSSENEDKCKRDVIFVLRGLRRDLSLGGNAGIVEAAEAYFTGLDLTGIPQEELAPTIFAFEKVRDLAILAMRNWKTGDGTGPVYTPLYETTIPLFTDDTIIVDPSTPICANVASAITTSITLLNDILAGNIAPGATTKTYGILYNTTTILSTPENTIYDANNKLITPRSTWDDLPYIEASPYTQNASVISFLGGGGALIDGSKVSQPNCPFPGLNIDGSATFAQQGKSMVAAAFTIITFGGTGYKIIEDGYCQLVSVFVLFAEDGVLAESGGYASITNSATNFGTFALRARGYNSFAYSFDVGIITNVSTTVTGRTVITVEGLGREPLEHYIIKIDGYSNANPDLEYFIDIINSVTVGPPFTAEFVIESGSGDVGRFIRDSDGVEVPTTVTEFAGKTIRLRRPSIVNSSSHTWEYAGSGTNYNALPENGGVKVEAFEQVPENYGRVYVSGTDELGDFKVGTFAKIENRTGNISFTGTVSISEVEFLKLRGGDVVVTGFDASNTLGGVNTSDSKIPTQKAVRDYITNNLGAFINKPFSSNAVPRALVELTDSGKISLDQIPPLRPFNVFTVANEAERLAIEGALAGDIAIQQDVTVSYILNNDNSSQFVTFPVDPALQFTLQNIFSGSITGGQMQATEYRPGVLYQINLTNAGSGYTSAPSVIISGGNPGGDFVQASAQATIVNGQVVTVKLVLFNGLIGGKGYTTPPTITFSAPPGAGVTAQGTALIESRLYGTIVNNIKISESDSISSSNTPPITVDVSRVVNTSASDINNWISLSTNQISATDITTGVISSSRLANNSDAANSFTFLRGDQSFAPVVQSLKSTETRYFAKLVEQSNIGSTQLIFATNSDVLVGHRISANTPGIADNTTITGIVTAAGTTTVSINNPLTLTLTVGTVIEFSRAASPIIFESSFTQGNFVSSIVILNGGQGFTDGIYFDVGLLGGSGTGLRTNITVTNGTVTSVVVTNGGFNYTEDFLIIISPLAIGPGTDFVLAAKLSTISRQYSDISVDIQRVTDLTLSADPFGTIGVSRFLKSQFTIGQAGNGSIQLKTGADSGLDADLLDGAQGSFYLNASNLSAGTLSTDRLSGTYNIGISGQSGSTLRLFNSTTNTTSNPSPSSFVSGVIADTRNNTADGLSDGGSRHLVLTLRNGSSGTDASFGGVRQLAFTDNDNMWIRGSGSSLTSFGSWAKIWSSLNDGAGSELDADRLDGSQGSWYRNALNINFGTLSDRRLSTYQSTKSFNNSIKILSYTGNPRYRIYFSGVNLTTAPFLAGLEINLYNVNAQSVGTVLITEVILFNDIFDETNNYSILVGILQTGSFDTAITAGTASNRVPFQDFNLDVSGTFQAASLDVDSGDSILKLGRRDGNSSTPAIYFNSSQLVSTDYNAAIIASGGNASTGSGSLNVVVANSNSFTINNNTIWNSGNVTFNSANVVSTAVLRDSNGNFSAGTITASLTGAASLNVLKTGDTMTGSLALTGTDSNLNVGGTLGVVGSTSLSGSLTVDTNTLFVDAANDRVGIGTASPTTGDRLSVIGRISSRSGSNSLLLNHTGTRSEITSNNELILFALGNNSLTLSTNSVNRLVINGSGEFGLGKVPVTGIALDVAGFIRTSTGLTISDSSNNNGASVRFLGSIDSRNFRIGNELTSSNVFEITPSTTNGGSTFTTAAFAIRGSDGNVAIGSTTFSNGDATIPFKLNVNGNLNFNGNLYQNGVLFQSSSWTQSTNGLDIYRLSRVGINKTNPQYALDVSGDINLTGNILVNGTIFTGGGGGEGEVIKQAGRIVAEDTTISSDISAASYGPVTIDTDVTVTVQPGGRWVII